MSKTQFVALGAAGGFAGSVASIYVTDKVVYPFVALYMEPYVSNGVIPGAIVSFAFANALENSDSIVLPLLAGAVTGFAWTYLRSILKPEPQIVRPYTTGMIPAYHNNFAPRSVPAPQGRSNQPPGGYHK